MPNINLAEKQLYIDSRVINYAEGPDNGPPMLLIHGISGRWQDWESVIPIFADEWRIYSVDLRGHGKSSWVPDGYHWRNYALDQVRFIEDVIQESAYIIGHSLGGSTALGLCAERSDLVLAAIFEDPPLFVHKRWNGNEFRSAFEATLEVLETDPDMDILIESLREMQPDHDDLYYQQRAEKLLAMDPDVYRSTISGRSRVRWRSEDLLPKATCPVLLLQAEPSKGAALWDEEAAEAMMLLPDAEYEKWEDSGHGMHVSYPDRFVERANRFFNKHR